MAKQLTDLVSVVLAGGAGLGLALPVAARPEVVAVVAECLRASAMIATAAGGVLAVGFVNHKFQLWAALRPPIYTDAFHFGFTAPRGPLTFAFDERTAAHEHEAAVARPDFQSVATWPGAITEFAFAAKLAGGFGWRKMAAYVGRDDWRACLNVLQDGGILSQPRGNLAPDYLAGWRYSRLRLELKYDQLSLPYPTNTPAPVINWRRDA